MAETASSVIEDALTELLVQAQEQSIQAPDFQISIRYMNRMMATFAANGISLGYTIVSNPADVITIPDGAIEGLIFNLALRLAKQFEMPVSQGLFLNAAEGKQAMRKLAITIKPTKFPCTLPKGSGNEGDFIDDKFFPCPEDSILTEAGGNISLESDT